MDALTQTLAILESMGITLPTRAYWIGALLFSIVGYFGYRYGKKASLPTAKWIGIALMFYPYVVWETWMMYTVGVALCIGLYLSSRPR
jgi:hypothetical protein